MGEKSRFIGEVGENLVGEVLSLIGWTSINNIQIDCTNKSHESRTHDIDKFSSYRCPLENDTAVDVAISIKYNAVNSGYKSEFLKYSSSLLRAFSCFKNNSLYYSATKGVYAKNRRSHHVLIWLNHNQNLDKSLVSEIGEIADTTLKGEEVILLDNLKLSFIHDSIQYAKSLYDNSKITFVYPRTGFNETIGGRALDGVVLPVNLLSSAVLPFKLVTKEQKKVLLLTVNEPFSEDGLKRIIGLAQNLTEGWCNKIVISYPDFQHLVHNQIKESVLMMFADSGFANMVDVTCFRKSFKSYENNLNPMAEPVENHLEFNIDTILPYGDQLRQLLNQSYIYKSDLQLLLRRRGVYVGSETTKGSLIPNLSKTLLSPSEFEFLRKKQNTKEASEKLTYENISVSNIEKAEAALREFNIILQDILDKRNNGCELIDYNKYIDDDGRIRFKYRIKRQDLTKDWAAIKSNHHGEIVLSKQQFGSEQTGFRIDKIGTSQETKDINRYIINELINHLKEMGSVKKSEVSKRISSSEFSPEQINDLLLSFIQTNTSSNQLKFKTITDIDFKPNDSVKLTEDIESLKDKVHKSFFAGTDLQEIKYVSDAKYRNMFIFTNIVADFFFDLGEYKGVAKIEYGFPDLLKDLSIDDEFEFKVLDVTPFIDRNLLIRENHELKDGIAKAFSKIVNDNHLYYQRKHGVQLEFNLSS